MMSATRGVIRAPVRFAGEFANACSCGAAIATVALSLLPARDPVRAEQPDLNTARHPDVTLICHLAEKKVVHVEIFNLGRALVIGDRILGTMDPYLASPGDSGQMIDRLIEDYRHRDGYQCSVTRRNDGQNN
jgi:hypothetical protein